jgi:signal transduction histidine kinase
MQVLLVEDDPSIRSALRDLLSTDGCTVTAAVNGRDAMRSLRHASPPDVVLLDLMMPVMDGWEFRVEQGSDPTLAAIPVIAMSADGSPKARAIAADAYVRKPIDYDHLVGQIRSVTGRSAQRRLAGANRMAALGRMAAGIGHEINNPLTFVLANLQVLRERLGEPGSPHAHELDELVAETLEGVERIRRVVKQTQLLSPMLPEEHQTTVDLQTAVDGAVALLDRELRQRSRLVTEIAPAGALRTDPGRLEQLVLNLLLNAAQSLDDARGHDNEIRVTVRPLPSDRALIEIADTGRGIPPEIEERVFQPFFTTRPVGQGTGLGLSISQGIAAALGGEISFESQVGRGTVFRVILPTTRETPPAQANLLTASARGGLPRVLVVDNEPSIVRAVRQILEPEHEVRVAPDAETAVALVESGQRFEVILCELMLPGINGMDLLEALRRTKPEAATHLVFMTAGGGPSRARRYLEKLNRPWLTKPFNRHQLLEALASVTASGGRDAAPPSPADQSSG